MKFLTKSQVDIIRGRASVDSATPSDVGKLLAHIDALEKLLTEEIDPEDVLGTEGWRHHVGIED
jgi:hypothetical protein